MNTPKINTNEKEIEEFLTRGVDEVITKEELKEKMMSGKQLRAYIGYDVTGPDLHLGHGATLMKLRHWQKLGHQVILVVGDDTSRIGDHSDKLEKRKRLTDKEIDFNKKQFKEQFGKLVDLDNAEVRYNSEWLDNLKFRDVVELASFFSVQQMIERENFAKRLKSKTTIGLEEILYPLMQGYDSVALEVDLEMGATDQRFNLLAGRKIQEAFGKKPQNVITVPFVMGTDGRKMGKSLGNYVPMRASKEDLFDGIMHSTDAVLIEYFERLTEVPMDEIKKIEEDLKANKVQPQDIKKRLAFEVTTIYYGEEQAKIAQEHSEKTAKGEAHEDVRGLIIKNEELNKIQGERSVITISGMAFPDRSNSEIKRLLEQDAVKVDGKKVGIDFDYAKDLLSTGASTMQFGKRDFVKIIPKD